MAKEQLQSDHWADQLARAILEWQRENKVAKLHVDDMKTPSGRVHVGALRGVVLHDVVAKVLAKHTDQPVTSTYIFNDMDSVDKIPAYLPEEKYQPWLGKPLHQTPPPTLEESGIDFSDRSPEDQKRYHQADNYGQFYAMDFIEAFRYLGCSQEIVWSHELYESGQMDNVIKESLDKVDEIKAIYSQVAEYDLPQKWYPFRAFDLRPEVTNTRTIDWDGQNVTYECLDKDGQVLDTHTVSPLGGTGKLLWKVDWPSHWKTLGITIEGAGKDHTSAGGSRDMADAECDRVFDITKPFDIPYEWILIRGAKMSSSKGIGTSAREFVMLFPPSVGRFLFVSKHYNQVIDFDPRTMAIPDLFDEYDQAARIHWQQEEGDQRLARSFELAQVDGQVPPAHFLPRFRDVATWMQHPEIDLESKFAEVKGSDLTKQEKEVLAERRRHAQVWLDTYAPDEFQLTAQPEMPEAAGQLSAEQTEYLRQAIALVESQSNWQPDQLQQELFELAKAGIGARAAFQAIYLAFIGKTHGPRAAWFLLAIDPDLRQKRLRQVQGQETTQEEHLLPEISRPDLLIFSPEYLEKYPSTTVGFAIIRGLKIETHNDELEQEKAILLSELEGLTSKELGEFPEIQSYRQMYKEMGIDWHSRRPSPEALLRRVAQGKDLYQVNTCVDAYNLAVMRHRVSVGVFDLDHIKFTTELKIAQGGEEILLLGDEEPTKLKAGEVSYFDQAGPYNLDYNYRDAQRTRVQLQTRDVWVNVEGVYDISRRQVEETLLEAVELIKRFCGGQVEVMGIAVKE